MNEREQLALEGLRTAKAFIEGKEQNEEKEDRSTRSTHTDGLISDLVGELDALVAAATEALTIAEGVDEPIEIFNLRRQLDEARSLLERCARIGVS